MVAFGDACVVQHAFGVDAAGAILGIAVMPRSNGETFTGLRPRGSDGMGETFLVQHSRLARRDAQATSIRDAARGGRRDHLRGRRRPRLRSFAGLLHRDVKPANALLGDPARGGRTSYWPTSSSLANSATSAT
ncbi:hypothetical protein ACT16_22490 [Mycobacterium heckeshornense]|nr:hypothetical protein ACT16_22490 [Mycobacterium heckeshornense]